MIQFAEHVAERCAVFLSSLGVALTGDPDATVNKVAIGVGCHIPGLEMLELGADVLVLTLHRAFQTTVRIPLAEMGANIIAVEHGVSEMPGMQSMARYIPQKFPGLQATFYSNEPATCTVQ